jgi:hypothetical protein
MQLVQENCSDFKNEIESVKMRTEVTDEQINHLQIRVDLLEKTMKAERKRMFKTMKR